MGALISAAIANALIGLDFINFPFEGYFPGLVAFVLIGRYVIFSISPDLQFGSSVKSKLAVVPRSNPNRYWYINIGRIHDFYIHYNKLDSIPKSATNSRVLTATATAVIGSASNSIGSSVLSDYPASRLFEQIEDQLRHYYSTIDKQPSGGEFWFNAKLKYIGRKTDRWGIPYTVILLDPGFECTVYCLKDYLTSQALPFSESAVDLNIKVEVFGMVGKSNNDWYIVPYVIIATL